MYNKIGKRIADILFAVILLIITSPIFVITAIAIKVNSRGPIIFRQQRAGINAQPFELYKFRSMRVETPEVASNDLNGMDYNTTVGKFIRKLSIDELPQLFNVLKGDMSVIGPRPVILKEAHLIELRHQKGADTVRPGITGLAQINGRDDMDDITKSNWDETYVNNLRMGLDVGIFIKTIISVIKRDGIVEEKIKG
ncbi:sugar transferase [Periweissella ghanensis]|uniref:Undecaprenyl phosphate N,N'-diacetylbacillosamine 1-phosphate transferase n=1 Tax=Periweissella ghanensis TaxID=467997 RepID=A0ABM8ZC33_9LACO|nr:sugar transferase [Periweissella ghanensis]MCM0600240.1 sugar transferase [Periweissella ghanensis]CAH0419128.1 Undecaprenyl phosphate N,N'-diacetylbacillosamine 1-phosphate transferase [Periweissella ghanensis]